MLRVATEGNAQYKDVWDVLMVHAADVVNNQPERGTQSPNKKAGATEIDMYREFHPALCHAVYKLPGAHVPDKYSERGMDALWCGRSLTQPGGHVLLPIEWDEKKGMWDVGARIVSTNVRVDRTFFPLCMRPKKGGGYS